MTQATDTLSNFLMVDVHPQNEASWRIRARELLKRGWPFAALWLIPALASTSQVYFLWQLKEDLHLTYWTAFVWQGIPWGYWLLVTPLLLFLGLRFPLERGRWLPHALLHLAVNVMLVPGHLALAAVMGRVVEQPFYLKSSITELMTIMAAKNVHLEALTYWGFLGLVHATKYQRRSREREMLAANLETKLVEAELRALKMQLHPHFLFNTLNAIAVLVRKQETQASLKMLSGLSDLLRMALENVGQHVVSLKQELDFLNRYLEIEQIRFRDRLKTELDIAPETLDAEIPNLILQPIVENAIRHGIAPRTGPGRIEIKARRVRDKLVVEVRDDGRGLADGFELDQCPGMGLRNVRARLTQLHPDHHAFSISSHPDGGVLVTIAVPFHLDEVTHHA